MQDRRAVAMLEERNGQGREGRKSRHQARLGDGADLDGNQRPAAPRLITQARRVPPARPGVQGHPSSRPRVGGEAEHHLGRQARTGEKPPHLIHLPGPIGRKLPMLQRAASAGPEVRTGRRHSLDARLQNLQQIAPPCGDGSPDGLTGKNERHVGAAFGEPPVALGADFGDAVGHLAPRRFMRGESSAGGAGTAQDSAPEASSDDRRQPGGETPTP